MDRNMEVEEEFQRLITTLPKAKGWMFDTQYQYHGFWYPPPIIRAILTTTKQRYFETATDNYSSNPPSPISVLLASHPKSGTTWLKSLLFAIMNRAQYPTDSINHPLLSSNPHECLISIELSNPNNFDHSNSVNKPLLLATHFPFHSLPDSIKSSSNYCRIVYVFRDPKDILISLWQFSNQIRQSNETASLLSIEEAADLFCEGKSIYGPYWDHVLTYWEENLNTPGRILFVSYEELKCKPIDCLKKLANFAGKPFSVEEEKAGVPENIVDLCSFKKQRDLEVNQPQSINSAISKAIMIPNNLFFRKGEVGDYRNYLTEEIIERIDKITEQKLGDIIGFKSSTLLA